MLSDVCGEVAAAFRRAWGRGPVKTSAHWATPDILLVLLEDGHVDSEKTLRAKGYTKELLGGRRLLQEIVEPELEAGVERATGRCIRATLSATHVDPDVSAEIFLFERRGSR
jgi:Na+-translocating membrane potential-generating system (MpsC)